MASKIWNGSASAFQESETPKVYSGSSFADSTGKYFDGTAWQDAWSSGPVVLTLGTTYRLSGILNEYAAKCIRADNGAGKAIMVGMSPVYLGPWPGASTLSLGSYFGSYHTAGATSGYILVSGTSTSDLNVLGVTNQSSNILSALYNASLGGNSGQKVAWLATEWMNGYHYYVSSGVGKGQLNDANLVIAPAFYLDLYKIKVSGTTITLR